MSRARAHTYTHCNSLTNHWRACAVLFYRIRTQLFVLDAPSKDFLFRNAFIVDHSFFHSFIYCVCVHYREREWEREQERQRQRKRMNSMNEITQCQNEEKFFSLSHCDFLGPLFANKVLRIVCATFILNWIHNNLVGRWWDNFLRIKMTSIIPMKITWIQSHVILHHITWARARSRTHAVRPSVCRHGSNSTWILVASWEYKN